MHVFFNIPLNKIDSASLKGISKKKKKNEYWKNYHGNASNAKIMKPLHFLHLPPQTSNPNSQNIIDLLDFRFFLSKKWELFWEVIGQRQNLYVYRIIIPKNYSKNIAIWSFFWSASSHIRQRFLQNRLKHLRGSVLQKLLSYSIPHVWQVLNTHLLGLNIGKYGQKALLIRAAFMLSIVRLRCT